ncbi:MAG: dihydrolipoamide acetyltransferase family protein [Chthoniobacterales bacterium]
MPIHIEMPKLSDTMTEGTLATWKVKEGDTVTAGDIIAEIETDKATMEMEVFDDGTIHALKIKPGEKAAIGTPIAILLEEGEDPASIKETTSPQETKTPSASAEKNTVPTSAPTSAPTTSSGERVKASPLARKIAAERGVDLQGITGTGPGGRIVAADVSTKSASAAAPASTPAPMPTSTPSEGDSTIPLSGMRRVIAERLFTSKTQIPHFYLHSEVDATAIVTLRKQLNSAAEASGTGKITFNDFVLLAAARAAVTNPKVNATFAGDAIIQFRSVNLAVAVAVEDGLVTPVIHDAQNLTLRQISDTVKDLASRARNKKLNPQEYQGGTITVSNLGAYGVERFAAIINPPQAAIIAVGAIQKKPVVNDKDEIVVGQQMSISLSCDHRVVDGDVGALYLGQIKKLLENPALMLF